jgi:hypothetical protein
MGTPMTNVGKLPNLRILIAKRFDFARNGEEKSC